MAFTEQIRGRSVTLTPAGFAPVHIALPDLDLYPPKVRKAVDHLLAVQATADDLHRNRPQTPGGRFDHVKVRTAEEEVHAAWNAAVDVTAATSSSAQTEYSEAYTMAARAYGRAIEAAVSALASMAVATQLHETAAGAYARLGLDFATKRPADARARFISTALEQLPQPLPIDAE